MEIEYRAADSVRALINSLGRTEDIRFSPSRRRLAIAAFDRSRIAVLDIEMARTAQTVHVAVTAGLDVSSPCLSYPHGLEFLDEETLAVANRQGDVAIFKLPAAGTGSCELSPIQVLAAGNDSLLSSPGSVSVVRREDALCELLVCNNSGNNVTRHVIDPNAGCSVISSAVLLKKWVNLPDGICVSNDRKWIAISNHNTHGVLLYEWSGSLNEQSPPDGVLRGAYFPHGLRFSADGGYIFVADAGAPFVHVYAHGGAGWRGAWNPAASVRIMDEQLFLRGRDNPQEGGPKGIDIDSGMNVLVATSELQPLLFLDAQAMLAQVPFPSQASDVEYEIGILQLAEDLEMRASHAETRAAAAESRAAGAELRAAGAELRAATAEARAIRAEARACHEEGRAAKFKAKAAKAKARTRFLVRGRPWWNAAPFARLYSAFKWLN